MHWTTTMLAAPVLVAVLAATPAPPPETILHVSGQGPGSAVLHLRTDVTIDYANAYPGGPVALRHEATTDFTAVVIQPLEGGTWHLLFVTDVFGSGDRNGFVDSERYGEDGLRPPRISLTEGDYLVHLLAEGPTSLDVVVEGLDRSLAVEIEPDPEVGFRRGSLARDVVGVHRTWTASHETVTDAVVTSFAWVHAPDPFVSQSSFHCVAAGRGRSESADPRACSQRDLRTGTTYIASRGGLWSMWPFPALRRETVTSAWHVAQVGLPQDDAAGLLQAWWPDLDPEG